MAKVAGGKVTIKKYANRRLYDTEQSSYITLDRLAAMIREGRDFEVIDAKSGEDITHQVLTQIIVEEESRGATMLPVNFLRDLIGLYGGQVQSAVPQYLDAAMDAFKKNQQAMAGAFSNTMLGDLTKRNLAMFETAASAITGKAGTGKTGTSKAARPADGAPADAEDELAQLKAQLASLQTTVDKLSK